MRTVNCRSVTASADESDARALRRYATATPEIWGCCHFIFRIAIIAGQAITYMPGYDLSKP